METNEHLLHGWSIADNDRTSFSINPSWSTPATGTPSPSSPTASSSPFHVGVISMTWLISGPIIFFVGLCGNALILVVMTRSKMTGTSTCVHLCIMAMADMVVLVIGLVPEWFEVCYQLKFKELHPVTCKLEKFLFYTSGDTSIWVLVIFTLDRLVAIAFPLRKKSVCTSGRAKLFGCVALLIAVIKNFHVFWTRGAEYKTVNGNITQFKSNCGKPTPAYDQFESFVRPWIVFTTVNVIPFVVILCCNVVIVRALFRVRRVSTIGALVSPSAATDRSLVQMTAMCLSASFCFLICITPSIVLVIGRPYWDRTTPYEIAKGFGNVLVYINHSVNFFLYCVTGRRFRRLLVWWLCRTCAPGWAGSMGESTALETHGTYLGHRASAFGLPPRKSSVGLVFGASGRFTDGRRGSYDDDNGARRTSHAYIRANSHATPRPSLLLPRTNNQETDV